MMNSWLGAGWGKRKTNNMKKPLLIGLMGIAALTMSSCITTSYVGDVYEARMVEATTPAPIVKPLTAELQLVSDTRVSDTWTFRPTEVAALGSMDNIRARALCLSAEKYSADVIVGALFKINYSGEGVCTVCITGYPATYVKWRTFEAADTIYLKTNPQYPVAR